MSATDWTPCCRSFSARLSADTDAFALAFGQQRPRLLDAGLELPCAALVVRRGLPLQLGTAVADALDLTSKTADIALDRSGSPFQVEKAGIVRPLVGNTAQRFTGPYVPADRARHQIQHAVDRSPDDRNPGIHDRPHAGDSQPVAYQYVQ
jgi:hypothetical protein